MKRLIQFLKIAFGLSTLSNAQTTQIKPRGVFKQIDVVRHNEAIDGLQSKNPTRKQQTIDMILQKPSYYNPPVIYALSRELFIRNRKEEATYWFYVAQLRARFDANLCMDNSAKQAVSILNDEYGPDINRYALQDIDRLEKTVNRVVDFVRSNEENYDHRWINLHGMDAVLAGMDDKAEAKELTHPKKEWAEIKKKTVDDYFSGFVKYVKNKK